MVDQWCKTNNPSSVEFLKSRLQNFIIRKAPYKNDKLKCYSAFGVVNGAAVCMGYSLFVKKVLDKKRIQNDLIYDRVKNHMYNRIEGMDFDATYFWASKQPEFVITIDKINRVLKGVIGVD
jgi:hypothetical protein